MPHFVEVLPNSLFKSTKRADFRVLVISNCQAEFLAPFFEIALADCACDYLKCYLIPQLNQYEALEKFLDENKDNYQLILSLHLTSGWQTMSADSLIARFGRERLFFMTGIYLDGLFPDQTSLGNDGAMIMSPMGAPHSKIALGGWLAGRALPEILQLFTAEVMEKLGYLKALDQSEQELRRREVNCDTEFTGQMIQVARSCFALYTHNHPTPNMLAHFVNHVHHRLVARGLARSSGVSINAMLAKDTLILNGVWPVYPELKSIVAPNYPVSTHFILPEGHKFQPISREVFVERSIAIYEKAGRDTIASLRQAGPTQALIEQVLGG